MFLVLLASIVNTTNHTKCISLNNLMAANITQIKNGITKNGNVSVNIQKNIKCEKKNYIWNPAACSCENGKYLESIIDDSVITCDEIINASGSVSRNVTSTVSKKNFLTKKKDTKWIVIFYTQLY